jgi:endonuclease III
MNYDDFVKIIKLMSEVDEVESEVKKNYVNNLWWPLEIVDKRMRLLIAGLSSRISYTMINTYRKIIFQLNELGYERLEKSLDEEIIELIKPLGMYNMRLKYIRSMMTFIKKNDLLILSTDKELFIKTISKEVYGASYKIGQCCALYYLGYESSIMPVDSGLLNVTLPCIGIDTSKNSYGHEEARLKLETSVKRRFEDIENIVYEDFIFKNPFWFSHLILIYYKRAFCNKRKWESCVISNSDFECSFKCKK